MPKSRPRAFQNDDDEDLDYGHAILGLLIIGLPIFFLCRCCCRRCCCRKTPADKETNAAGSSSEEVTSVTVDGQSGKVSVEFLRQPKGLCSAYTLWACGGIFGAHLFHLGRLVHGGLAVVSLNFFFIGWFCDFFLIPQYVKTHNAEIAPLLLDQKARRRCCSCNGCGWLWRLMLAGLVASVFNYATWVEGPRILERLELVDIDAQLAGTGENPYDLLGVPRDTDLDNVIHLARTSGAKATRQRNLDHPSCNEACKSRRKEMQQKAMDYFKKKQEERATAKAERAKKKKKKHDDDWEVDDHIDRWADRWKGVALKIYEVATPYFSPKGSEEEARTNQDEL